MSDDQEESWRWHCLEVELRRLSSIRERARIELDPDRLARVEGILRGLASADPTRSNVLQQKEPVYSYDDDDDATRDPLLHYRPLHDRGEPWPGECTLLLASLCFPALVLFFSRLNAPSSRSNGLS
jgi:hypothetical protein